MSQPRHGQCAWQPGRARRIVVLVTKLSLWAASARNYEAVCRKSKHAPVLRSEVRGPRYAAARTQHGRSTRLAHNNRSLPALNLSAVAKQHMNSRSIAHRHKYWRTLMHISARFHTTSGELLLPSRKPEEPGNARGSPGIPGDPRGSSGILGVPGSLAPAAASAGHEGVKLDLQAVHVHGAACLLKSATRVP